MEDYAQTVADHEYIHKLGMCLVECQLIEEMLKTYIEAVDLAIHLRMKGFIHYELAGKDLNRLPLGPLIRQFDKRTDRKDIVKSLKALAGDRNFFAHQAYLLSTEKAQRNVQITQLTARLELAAKKADTCVRGLIQEVCRVRGESVPPDFGDHAGTGLG